MEIDDNDHKDHSAHMLADNLEVLIRQENSGNYTCTDYLSMTAWQNNVFHLTKEQQKSDPGHGTSPTSTAITANTRIDEYCREQIVEWSFRVVDYFRIDREVVAVSLSFLDRFLATCRCDRTSFKLAATTTLHLAVKLLYPCKLADLGILSDLSRGEFDMTDVSEMETQLLNSLNWKLHPPTSIAFAVIFLDHFFSSTIVNVSNTDVDDIYDVSSFLCELAVTDYFFVPMRGSNVAIAAILNALEGMFGPDNHLAPQILRSAQLFGIQQDLSAARNRLWELYERSEECALHNREGSERDDQWLHNGSIFVKKMSTVSSPVSVSKPCHSATDFPSASHSPMIRNESW